MSARPVPLRFVVSVLLAALCATGLLAQSSTALRVTKSSVVDGRLTITGQNLSGAGVTIGKQPVDVATSSDTEIVVFLPSLEPGLYAVRVSRDGGATADGTANFTLVIQ